MYRMILAHDIKISNMIVSAFKKSNLRKTYRMQIIIFAPKLFCKIKSLYL